MASNVKYRGVLGQRSNDMCPTSPPQTVLGPPSQRSKSEHKEATRQWVRNQVLRELDGIVRLLKHYKIEDSEDRFFHLALALAHEHVPYCMVPARGRGRPKKMQQILPIIDGMARMAKSAGQPQAAVYETFAEILNVKTESIIREVKRFRSRGESGGKRK